MNKMGESNWKRGGKAIVLDTYEKLHEGKLGAHWIWFALERIANGEMEQDVMRDYGYQAAIAHSNNTAEPVAEKWMPIESAPTNNVPVLVSLNHGQGITTIAATPGTGQWWQWDSLSKLSTPTHWMPLPDAPSSLIEPADAQKVE